MEKMKLSVLICGLEPRLTTFLPGLLRKLNEQAAKHGDVEVLVLIDNKSMTVGEKRNRLLSIARGEYVTFVDDDDDVTDDYIDSIIDGCQSGCDVVTFDVLVSLDGSDPKPCFYSRDFGFDYDTEAAYHRIPNHIMCIKRDLCIEVGYPNISRGEDADFARRLLHRINSEHRLSKHLYLYNFDSNTTETQRKT